MTEQVNLKYIPDVDWSAKIACLVKYNLRPLKIHGAWRGPARLHFKPHVNAPAADLPIKEIVEGGWGILT
jgi:acetoacetate decarboxylase